MAFRGTIWRFSLCESVCGCVCVCVSMASYLGCWRKIYICDLFWYKIKEKRSKGTNKRNRSSRAKNNFGFNNSPGFFLLNPITAERKTYLQRSPKPGMPVLNKSFLYNTKLNKTKLKKHVKWQKRRNGLQTQNEEKKCLQVFWRGRLKKGEMLL